MQYIIKIGIDKFHPSTIAMTSFKGAVDIYWNFKNSVQDIEKAFYVSCYDVIGNRFVDITQAHEPVACSNEPIKDSKNVSYMQSRVDSLTCGI